MRDPEVSKVRVFDEYIEDVSFETVQDSDESQVTRIRGIAKRAGRINKNRRFYSRDSLSKAVENIQDEIQRGSLVGLIRHPNMAQGEPAKGHPSMTAVKWTGLKMDGDDAVVEGIVVGTAAGRDLKALVDAKVKVGLSTNVKGSVKYVKARTVDESYADGNQLVQVIDDLEFQTIDVVNGPADQFASILTDEEAIPLTLEELKKNFPELYRQVQDEVEKEEKVNDELVRVLAENKALKERVIRQERKALVDEALATADLPKVGSHNKVDYDKQFADGLLRAAQQEEDEDAAKTIIDNMIAERKVLLSGFQDEAKETGLPIRRKAETPKKEEVKESSALRSIRASLGL